MDLGSAGDYIHLAARQICLAQEFEANGEFEQAFATYKSCVGILLQGVQVDQNKGRRDAVRRKTAQYLMKAEELYNRHLAKDVSDDHRWAMDSTLSPSTEVDPALTFLRAPASDLKKFKVLGTINKVILVLDKSTEETFVIKRVYKCSKGHNSKQNILPTLCPYMVNLHKFYETSNAVYLLLQYASGGKLWNYVGAYLRAAQEQNREGGTAGPGINENTPRQDFQNVYTGYKEHHDSNKRKSFLEAKPGLKAEEITKGGNTKLVDKVAFSKESDTVELNQQRLSPVKDLSVSDFQFDVTNKLETYSVDISDLIADSNQVSAIDVIPETSQSTTKTHVQYNRYTSFSSEENVEIENDSCSSIERQPSGGANFNDILEKNTKKAGLENFSINSFDSGDGITRVDSNMSENIEAIQEVNENSCDIDVFSCDIQHNPEYARNNDIDFTFGNVETSTGIKHSNQATHDHEQKNGNNSNKLEDGVETDTELDIVRNSKELLKAVERTLSQIDCDEKTRKDHDVPKTNGTQQVNNDKLTNAVSAALGMMGPSIYDLQCHGDSSNSQSDSGSGSRSLEDSQPVSLNSNYNEINKSALVINEILSTVDTANNEGKDETRSRTSSDIILNRKLSLNRLNSAEFSRSASTDTEARSPTKTRQRTISMMFEQLDLTSQTSEQVKIPESFIRRWAAEMIVAVSRLHALGIICRELKPDNILLGDHGHATLTYFCQINQVPKSLDFEAVGNFYVAPEVIGISGYTETCDWWSLGALLYELLVGRSLLSCHPGGITSHTQLYMPDHLSQEAQSLLQQLLVFNPRERLGAGLHGVVEIKTHPFFNGIDWNSMDM
ncbi:hypothetical protein DPMN_093787 [Dreissena polymorpha]|uniref:Protein kinase domain-containing protein n=2 Tax=Dreissena polymorpha TaxID=45954 RepID=A0A9D4L671_DREPO|nr:hypothetical protein DPMN_093787 [Dreissena polymorpha]